MNILDKDTIKTRILPKLSIGKRGKRCSEEVLIGIIELILYRLTTKLSMALFAHKDVFTRIIQL